ncbi:unnamed protein product [Gongylonema pulchrum]|uniref:Uncharacterized protein n=1 Tax=Gongylonema pulchrum TaxID=637853 RepID=A0A183ENI9_9BILA|nr:unnamed protein product [Gongylonema pulchrum]
MYGFVHYEVSVALNLDIDDLLVGLIAEIRESVKPNRPSFLDNVESVSAEAEEEPSDFKAAIRRYSKRKREQMGGAVEAKTNKCTHFKSNLIERFRNWRRSLPRLQQ